MATSPEPVEIGPQGVIDFMSHHNGSAENVSSKPIDSRLPNDHRELEIDSLFARS